MCLMVAAFLGVVTQRHQIRAWWYIHQLDSTSDNEDRIAILSHLSAELAASDAALLSALKHPLADVRLLAIPLATKLDASEGIPALNDLLDDGDRDIRDLAALMLAFDRRDAAWACLRTASESDDAVAAEAAVGAIGRSTRDAACCVLVRALQNHPAAIVRAQAAESLILILSDEIPSVMSDHRVIEAQHRERLGHCDGCSAYEVLAEALSDTGEFRGTLAYERELQDLKSQAIRNGWDFSAPGLTNSPTNRRKVGRYLQGALENTLAIPAGSLALDAPDLASRIREAVDQFAAHRFDDVPATMPVESSSDER